MSFTYPRSEPELSPTQHEPQQDLTPTDTYQPAADANELVFTPDMAPPPPPRSWPKAKMSASFPRAQDVVFQASVQATRSCKCDVVSIDRANYHLRFSIDPGNAGVSLHDLFAFDTAGSTEIDLTSQDPDENYQFEAIYQAIIKEMGKYLMFAAEAQPGRRATQDTPYDLPPPPPPAPLPPAEHDRRRNRYDDDDDWLERRRSRQAGADGLSIAGFICGVVGLVLFCIPYIGGPLGVLGIVFGGIGLMKRKNGFAVAALTCGIIACVLSLIFFLAIISAAERHRY